LVDNPTQMVEERRFPQDHQAEGAGFTPDKGIVVSRTEVKTIEASQHPKEQAFNDFLALVAQDPNIQGVVISRITNGGIFTDWFVREIVGEQARNSMEIIGKSYRLLGAALGDRAGYGGFWPIHDRTFEEMEAVFREKWTTPSNGPFDFNLGRAHGENLELAGIIKFE